MKQISSVFTSKKKALIPYITAGDPDLEMTGKIILNLDRSGADIIEVGIPYSDPLADGPVIQAAGQRALQSGTSLKAILEMLSKIKDEITVPVLLMGYYNCFLQYGKNNFIEDALNAGVQGVIIPDLPYDQDENFYNMLQKNELAGILMATPVSSEERLREIGNRATGFVYCVSLLGVTGASQGPMTGLQNYIEQVRQYIDLPLALGFGIDGPQKAFQVKKYVDGVIIGSALVRSIDKYKNNPGKLMNELSLFMKSVNEVL